MCQRGWLALCPRSPRSRAPRLGRIASRGPRSTGADPGKPRVVDAPQQPPTLCGVTDSRRTSQQRLSYLNLTAADAELLTALRPALERHAAGFVAAFYRNLLSFAPTRELLREPGVKERLLVKQREYLLSLARPELRRGLRGPAPTDRRGAPADRARAALVPRRLRALPLAAHARDLRDLRARSPSARCGR